MVNKILLWCGVCGKVRWYDLLGIVKICKRVLILS